MEAQGGTVSAAVREHLRQLCLHEFPCGTGSWNKSRFLPRTWRTWRELIPREEDVGSPGEETVEDLLGLVCSPHSPWALLEGSSAEDRFLRQLAIQNPLMLKDSFFYSYFRSLHVVDKQVRLVDKGLLKFLNLEELVLSANQIQEVDAVNLPPTLKVLELYGNGVASMACLCAHPPPALQHLGLGHNKLLGPSQSRYVTREHWPHLVSLDLGFNDLTDLQGMVGGLGSLRHLRLLVLQGNPLALVPYYRGLTVDSLARLCVLDDITVSPSEKHQFRGLSHSGDFLPREAQLVVTIGNVRGVLDSSILDPEPGPQGPFITYTYYVTYDFVEDEEGEGSELVGVLAEVAEVAEDSPLQHRPQALGRRHPLRLRDAAHAQGPGASQGLPAGGDHRDHRGGEDSLLASGGTSGRQSPACQERKRGKGQERGEKQEGKGRERQGSESRAGDRQGLPPRVRLRAGSLQGSKKKKELPKELRQDPPILRVLGRGMVGLEPLLMGEPLVSTVCNFGVIRTVESDKLTFLRDSKNKKAKKAFEGDYAPEPLTVEVQVQLSQCRSAEEAFRLMPP
uniref:Leucine rich repeat containing 43 n=1 Tax=Rousettus aegyptiacus TaxID=9407 RepID=A0A7J8H207_ROUAE|nr:leucine rich repeat containing 43 [Rousettus aegyptiacus]